MANPVTTLALRFARGLRFPTLFFITAALFVGDLLIPDAIPFVDELLLAMGSLLLASLRKRKQPEHSDDPIDQG
ncbi:MAG: hypothetical protein OXU20_04560 [Myxococcales bacterium]|nr:hypothetical protein [Myxococcales bacterium]MDD9969692.1 hypothetical protein [Myxococcales bacterium]